MNTKLKLSHDEMVVLAVIADQELTSKGISEEISKTLLYDVPLQIRLEDMRRQGILTRQRKLFAAYYKIAPEILSLNQPPYSYESWRNLSE